MLRHANLQVSNLPSYPSNLELRSTMLNTTLRMQKRLLACASFALLSLNAVPALATDWWMIFGTGDTPILAVLPLTLLLLAGCATPKFLGSHRREQSRRRRSTVL